MKTILMCITAGIVGSYITYVVFMLGWTMGHEVCTAARIAGLIYGI